MNRFSRTYAQVLFHVAWRPRVRGHDCRTSGTVLDVGDVTTVTLARSPVAASGQGRHVLRLIIHHITNYRLLSTAGNTRHHGRAECERLDTWTSTTIQPTAWCLDSECPNLRSCGRSLVSVGGSLIRRFVVRRLLPLLS
jgi:hypothetical protein